MRTKVKINRTERDGTRRSRVLAARLLLALTIVLLLAGSGWLAERASAQSADQVFAPVVNGAIGVVALQADGRILIGGTFTQVDSVGRTYFARLLPNGALDTSFNVVLDGQVQTILVLPDQSIVIGGKFAQAGGVNHRMLAHIQSTGTVDHSFTTQIYADSIGAVKRDANGKLLVGGAWVSSVNGQSTGALFRLNASGTLDTSFGGATNDTVSEIEIADDGKIYVAGGFSSTGGSTQRGVARLNSTGTRDTSFSPVLDAGAYGIAIQPDGRILLSGGFSKVNNTNRSRLVRLMPDGTIDNSFIAQGGAGSNYFRDLNVLPDGRIAIWGTFQTIGLTSITNFAILGLTDGALLPGYSLAPNGGVNAFVTQPDGNWLLGGGFTQIAGQSRSYIARLSTLGAIDAPMTLGTDNDVYAISHLPNGSLYIGGAFALFGGQSQSGIGRLTPAGVVDTAYPAYVNGTVFSLLADQNGTVTVAGQFTSIVGQTRSNLAQVDASGGLVAAYAPNPNGAVLAMARDAGGNFILGGDFTTIAGQTRQRIARLSGSGVLDASFAPAIPATVRTIAVQNDGRILVGGDFTTVNSVAAGYITRLAEDGQSDGSLAVAANGPIRALALQPNGAIIAGGAFTSVNDQLRPYLARFDQNGALDPAFAPEFNGTVHAVAVQPNGKILVAGVFTSVNGSPRGGVARLNADGSLDPNYNPNANGAVYALAVLPDGKIVIGGAFTQVGGQSHSHLARLSTDEGALQPLEILSDGDTTTWWHDGAGPVPTAVAFEVSIDGANYTSLGSGEPIAGGWQLTGAHLPLVQNVWVRAIGGYPSGQSGASLSAYSTVRLAYIKSADVLMNTIVSGGAALPSEWIYLVGGKEVAGGSTLRIDPGNYVVTPTVPAGYSVSAAGSACSLAAGIISMNAALGSNECSVTFTRDTGAITFVKVVDGGTAQPANFSFAAGGKSAGHTQQMTLETGTYTVTESGTAGYVVRAVSGACALVDGAIRLTVTKAGGTCTVTNTAPVTFTKIVEGGVNVAGDWSFAVAGQGVAHGAQTLLAPGTYTVTESGPSGYTLVAAEGDCTLSEGTVWLTVPAGSASTATCTLTNRRDQGTITFATTVEGEGATVNEFTYTVLGKNAGDGGQLTLDTDFYTVSVTKPATFVPRTASGACALVAGALRLDVTQAGGTCAVTFTRLVRFVNVVEGGTRSPGAWSFRVSIDGVEQIVFHNRDVLLAPGTYTATQQGAVDYYSLADASGNCTLNKGKIVVNAPGSGICTVTNVRNTGGIWFNRIVQGDGGARPEDWVVMVENLPVSMGVTVTLDTDTYTVYESGPTDYALTLAGGICSLSKGKIVLEVTEAGGECLLVSTPGVGPVGFVVAPSGGTAQPSAWEFAVAGQRILHNGALLMPIGVFPISLVGPADYVVTGATGICSYDGTDLTMVVGTEGGTCNVALAYDPNAANPDPDPGTDPNPSDAAFLYLPTVQR